MEDVLEFLARNPGPWAVGLATQSQLSEDYTAGSFHVICDNYMLTEDRDGIIFSQGDESNCTAEVAVILPALQILSIEANRLVGAYLNLNVAVPDFEPYVFFYIQAVQQVR